MDKTLYNVVAIKDRVLTGADGKHYTADEGYIVHSSFQRADSPEDAIEQVKSYHMTPGTKYDRMEAVLASEIG